MISYTNSLDVITPQQLAGFFVGWPNPPAPATHLKLLRGSDAVELAIDGDIDRVVGYIAALTDDVMTLHISFLEVLPAYQRRGIGSQLVRRLFRRFDHLYGVDLSCDEDVQPFYEKLGMTKALGMNLRQHGRQSGA